MKKLSIISAAVVSVLILFQNCAQTEFTSSAPEVNGLSVLQYNWIASNWGACSVACGGGTQTRTVECRDNENNVVDSALCTVAPPDSSLACNVDPCSGPAPSPSPSPTPGPTPSPTPTPSPGPSPAPAPAPAPTPTPTPTPSPPPAPTAAGYFLVGGRSTSYGPIFKDCPFVYPMPNGNLFWGVRFGTTCNVGDECAAHYALQQYEFRCCVNPPVIVSPANQYGWPRSGVNLPCN